MSSPSLPLLFSVAQSHPPSCRQTRSARNGALGARLRHNPPVSNSWPVLSSEVRACARRITGGASTTYVVPKLGFHLPEGRTKAALYGDQSPVSACRRGSTAPEASDLTAPHSVPPNTPHTKLRADRRRRGCRAGVSWLHDRHETVGNAWHASPIQSRASSNASIRICVRLCDSWPGRRHASALSRRRSRLVTFSPQVASDVGRCLRSLLLGEPAGRINRRSVPRLPRVCWSPGLAHRARVFGPRRIRRDAAPPRFSGIHGFGAAK